MASAPAKVRFPSQGELNEADRVSVDITTFEQTADDLDAVLRICDGADVPTNGTRMAVAAKRIREIARLIRGHTPAGPLPLIGGFRDVFLLIEGSEFATLLPCLERWLATDRAILTDKLKKVLSGPQVPTEESAVTNQARNILFELTLGAKFEQHERRVTQGEHPDVTVHLPKRDIFVECKRVFSPSKVKENVSVAARQIREALNGPGVSSSTFGVVAVDASKVINPDYECCAFNGEAELTNSMAKRLSAVVDETESLRERFRSQRIVGVVYRFVAVGHDRRNSRYVCATQDIVVSLGGPQYVSRYAAFEAFRQSLGIAGTRYRPRVDRPR